MGDVGDLGAICGGGDERCLADDIPEMRNDALQMMVQALAYMQEAMKTMEAKMDKTDDTVRNLTTSVVTLEQKFAGLEKDVHVVLGRKVMKDIVKVMKRNQDPPPVSQGIEANRDLPVPLRCQCSESELQGYCDCEGHLLTAAARVSSSQSRPHLALDANTQRKRSLVLLLNQSRSPVALSFPQPTSSTTDSSGTSSGSSTSSSTAMLGAMAGRLPSPRDTLRALAATRSECDTSVLNSPASPAAAAKRRVTLGRNLLTAAQEGCTKDVLKLLKDGADVNFTNRSKMTPLHMAAMRGQASVVALLLERDANPNARTAYGFTAMHMAAHNDRTGLCVSLLVYAGCDVNSRNQFGRTPLHYAADCGNEAAVRALVAAGASKTAKDDEGRSPLNVAKTNNVRNLLAPPQTAPCRPRSRGRRCRSSVDHRAKGNKPTCPETFGKEKRKELLLL